eukprot:1619286-Pyramimonas_sp.AAC.1
MGTPFDELFSQGLFADISLPVVRPVWNDSWAWRFCGWGGGSLVVPDGSFVFTDGSCLNGDFPHVRSAGWAVI